MLYALTCMVGGALLLVQSGFYVVIRSVSSPAICQMMARELTPFQERFHFETPRCLIEVQTVKGDRSR